MTPPRVLGYFQPIANLLIARDVGDKEAEKSAVEHLLDADSSVLNEALIRYGATAFEMIADLISAPVTIESPLLNVLANPFTGEVVIPPAPVYAVEGAKAMLYQAAQPRAVGELLMMISALDFQPALQNGVLINSAVPNANKFVQTLVVAKNSSYQEEAVTVAGHAGWLATNHPHTT